MKNQSTKSKEKIIVADSSATMRQSIQDALKNEYSIITADNGLQVLERVAKHHDVACIVMDLMMPQLDGFKTTHILKSNFATYHIPIIILTSQVAPEDMTTAVTMGADDYMRKPFDVTELKARLVMNIRRAQRDQSANPLTMLPGNAIINRTILTRLGSPVAILYTDLDNFKAYNDKYGFHKGDLVLKHAAHILMQAIKTVGNPSDFLGHIGGDDFIAISTPDKAEIIATQVCTTFDSSIDDFYNEEDRKHKRIISYDRQGNPHEFPLISLSVAIVTNEKRELTSTPQIAQIAAELKHYAKTKPGGIVGSNYVKDRRSS